MKRSTWDGATVVYRYGCPAWADLPDEAVAQLRLAHDLCNDLVAVEYRYREMVAAIWGLHPEVAAAQAAVDATIQICETVAAEIARQRVRNQSTVPAADSKTRMSSARVSRREALAELKRTKDAARAEMRALFDEASAARKAAITHLRGEAVERGLFWSTANFVKENHDAAAKQIAEAWKQGRVARRRFRRWDGTGTLATQLQRQSGMPQRSAELLASGQGPWRNVVQLSPWVDPRRSFAGRGSHRHGTLTLRVAAAARSEAIVLPVVLHRPIPAEADITDVRVTRRRIAGQYRLSVAVVVHLPRPASKIGGEAVAVRLGWSSVGNGFVRVARVSSAPGSLPAPPPDIADLVVVGNSYTDVHAHAEWGHVLDHGDSIRSVRDELLDDLRPIVVEALADEELAELVGASAARVAQWRAQRRFAALARRWPQEHPVAAKLTAWRERDAHLWEYEAHERDQVCARRRDAWRKVAAWLCTGASVIAVHGLDVAGLRRKPDVSQEDPYRDRHARRNAVAASPGELRTAIINAAARRGIEVVYVTESQPSDVEVRA